MSIGTISSPATWLLGTVAPPAWFQAVQDNVNGFLAGTDSMNGLVLDGTGGQSVSPVAGGITVSAVSGGTAAPTPSFVRGVVYKESPPFVLAHVQGNTGGLYAGSNIASITRNSTGDYTITLNTAIPSSTTRLVAVASLLNNGPTVGYAIVGIPTTSTIHATTYNTSAVLTDLDFSLIGFAI